MRHLQRLVEDTAVQRLVDFSRERRGFTGVSLRYDDVWFALWSAYSYLLPNEFELFQRQFVWFSAQQYPGAVLQAFPSPGYADPHWSCEAWEYWSQRHSGVPEPVVVELQRLPGPMPNDEGYLWKAVAPELPGRLTVTARVRPQTHGKPAHVWQSGGCRGSVGGVLSDPDGTFFVTTAAHVAPAVGQVTYLGPPSRARAGLCVETGASPHRGACTDESAFVRVEAHDLSGLPIRPADDVVLRGDVPFRTPVLIRTARRDVVGEVYQYIARRVVDSPEGVIDIVDGFEVRRHIPGLFSPPWRTVTRPGDSGASVVMESEMGVGWCGTIVGGDSISSVATFAENTMQRFRTLQ